MTLQSTIRPIGLGPIILGELAQGGRLRPFGAQLTLHSLVLER
jgi:predicted dinucleotide-binding enzyme